MNNINHLSVSTKEGRTLRTVSESRKLIVNDEVAKQRILSAMADQYSRKILTATVNEPVSALDLSKRYQIPITTVYRRIEELVEAGLIAAVKSGRTADGKWYDLYRSLLRRIDVGFENGDVWIEAEVNEHVADKFTRMWASIPKV
ncbi:MAG: helix-turn-helix domain-containing protein [Candidatus Bathyarchaeia archaeon]|jgi:DNA-binding transcriptional ArsR family regulator